MNKLILHIKTGIVYTLISEHVINSTNENDGQRMVLYMDNFSHMYVREETEFWEKFKYIQE